MIDLKEASLTPAEWEIMRVAWTAKETTSKEVSDILNDKMNWKPVTTKTLIGRLVKKGFLKTEQDGKRYLYSPAVEEDECLLHASGELFEHVCQTKKGELLAKWIEESLLSQSDLDAINAIVEKKKETAPSTVACECTPGQCDCNH